VLLSDYLAALRSGWKIMLGTLLVALGLALAPTFGHSPVYSSSTDLFVAANADGEDQQDLYQRNAFVAQRILSYVELASGDVVAAQVSEQVGRDLRASVVAEAVAGTVVLRITASSSDPEQARDVAAAYAEVMPRVIAEIDDVGDPDSDLLRVSVIDTADLPGAPAPVSRLPNVVLGLVLGLGLGLVIVVLRETLRRETRASKTPESM
jgi:capsular polysaccharide biosynthesis protein